MSTFSEYHQQLSQKIEAILHASETPITYKQLKQWLAISNNDLEMALLALQQRLSHGALVLFKTASGYRLQIANEFSPLIQKIFPQRQEHLSQALLETLSIIAYKQPVTRADIEHIRGVRLSSNILRQLFDKGWIEERGFKETLGRPALLYTTPSFLDAFGLTSIEQLPEMPNIEPLPV